MRFLGFAKKRQLVRQIQFLFDGRPNVDHWMRSGCHGPIQIRRIWFGDHLHQRHLHFDRNRDSDGTGNIHRALCNVSTQLKPDLYQRDGFVVFAIKYRHASFLLNESGELSHGNKLRRVLSNRLKSGGCLEVDSPITGFANRGAFEFFKHIRIPGDKRSDSCNLTRNRNLLNDFAIRRCPCGPNHETEVIAFVKLFAVLIRMGMKQVQSPIIRRRRVSWPPKTTIRQQSKFEGRLNCRSGVHDELIQPRLVRALDDLLHLSRCRA